MRLFTVLLVLNYLVFPKFALSQGNSQILELADEFMIPTYAVIKDVPVPPISSSYSSLKSSSLRLATMVAILVKTQTVNRDNLNLALQEYNNLIVLLGLTDSRQLEYFPKLKATSIQLNQLRQLLATNAK